MEEFTSLIYKKPFEIEVQFFGKDVEKELGLFQFVLVENCGEDTAVEAKPLIRILDIPDAKRVYGLLPVKMIPPNPISARLMVQWEKARKEFDSDEHRFATALLADKNFKTSVTLHGFGISEGFALAFTVRGSNVVYLPTSDQNIALPMPCTFVLALYFQANNLRLYLAKVYRVDAKSWDSINLTPIREPTKIAPHLRLGYLSLPKPS